MSNIITIENPMPLKAIPSELLQSDDTRDVFAVFISNLLSIKAENLEKIYMGWEAVKKLCWSMSMSEIKEMFEMYAYDQLGIPPRSNHFDIILVGTIFNTYKSVKLSKPKPKKEYVMEISEEEMKRNAYLNCIFSFDNFNVRQTMDRSDWVVYDELDSRKLFDFTKDEKLTVFETAKEKHPNEFKESWIERSKIILLERFYLGLIAKGKHIKELL